jgi:class 3 adenylate cyclase/DNA-binding CsgD family transcriptional regulator
MSTTHFCSSASSFGSGVRVHRLPDGDGHGFGDRRAVPWGSGQAKVAALVLGKVMNSMEPLTRRQREVASLLAQGLTNRQIAERMVLSERTVESHIEQIRSKLDVRSRTQIVAWVLADRVATAREAVVPEIRYARSSGVDIAYQVFGVDSPDLLALSSALIPIDSIADEPRLDRFHQRLASFSRVIRFDVRGVGMSDPIATSDPPTLEQWAQDAVAVLDAEHSEHAAVFAPRDSSLQAILLAATHPDRVRALIIVNGTARFSRAADYPAGFPRSILENFLEVNMDPDAVGRGLDYLASVAPSVAGDRAFRAWWKRAGNRGASPSTARALQAVSIWADVRPLLSHIRVPTLILHHRDNIVTRAGHGRYLAEHIPEARYRELPGADDLYWVGDNETMLAEIEDFLGGPSRRPRRDRVVITVLVAGIIGSAAQIAHLGDRRWRDLLDRHEAATRRQLARFQGRQINTPGDGLLATFDGPARAVSCACAIRDAAAKLGLEIRAGVHTGEAELRGDGISGMAVVIAAGIASVAQPRQVLVSNAVVGLVVGSGITTDERGELSLKGVPGSWRLFEAEA